MKKKYIETPVKNNIKEASKQEVERILGNMGTWSILWHLTKRHKFGLVSVWAIIMTAAYVFPPLPDVLLAIVR